MQERERERLRWRCRRGLREMDLLLENFLDTCYATLNAAERAAFVNLLNEADQDIMAWVLQLRTPPQQDYHRLLEQLTAQWQLLHHGQQTG